MLHLNFVLSISSGVTPKISLYHWVIVGGLSQIQLQRIDFLLKKSILLINSSFLPFILLSEGRRNCPGSLQTFYNCTSLFSYIFPHLEIQGHSQKQRICMWTGFLFVDVHVFLPHLLSDVPKMGMWWGVWLFTVPGVTKVTKLNRPPQTWLIYIIWWYHSQRLMARVMNGIRRR